MKWVERNEAGQIIGVFSFPLVERRTEPCPDAEAEIETRPPNRSEKLLAEYVDKLGDFPGAQAGHVLANVLGELVDQIDLLRKQGSLPEHPGFSDLVGKVKEAQRKHPRPQPLFKKDDRPHGKRPPASGT